MTETKVFKPYSPQDEEFLGVLRQEIFLKIKDDNKARRQHADDAQIRSDVDLMLSVDYEKYKVQIIERDTGVSLKGKKLLEIGSGLGFFLVVSRSLGIDSYGTEPYSDFYEHDRRIADSLLSYYGLEDGYVFSYAAERMEFPDNFFDIVASHYVFEHVRNPLETLKECMRVLKPDGYLHFVFPNYGSFWEGHYAVPWIPNLNRRWGGRYVRWIWRRSPFMVDTLNLMNEKKVLQMLRSLEKQVQLVNLGRNIFEKELSALSFNTTGSIKRVKWIFEIMNRAGLLSLFVRVILRCGLYTPFYMTLRKR